jgi:VanZ family protein
LGGPATIIQTPLLHRAWLWLPPLALMALIFQLSSQPDPLPAVTERVWDKALHLGAYAALGLLFFRAFLGEGAGRVAAAALAFGATSAYGASDEWHQLSTPGRQSGLDDWMADTVGGAIGIAIFPLVARARSMARTRWWRRS